MRLENYLKSDSFILTEGALVERLKSECQIILDSFINHAGLIYDDSGRLTKLYRQYIEIAIKYDIPIMLMTPTRKVNFETHKKSMYSERALIKDACTFLKNLRNEYPAFCEKVFIGGLLGCRGDAFKTDEALGVDDSYEFHKIQVNQFKDAQVDFLFAGLMPEINEAIGMAKAMAESGISYIISFTVRKNGCLLDGTSIANAIKLIDSKVYPKPIGYMSNCIHPLNLKIALEHEVNRDAHEISRFLGIQANASSLSPEELNNCAELQQENFDDMIDEITYLTAKFNLKILGGCCGTDQEFFEKLAMKLLQ
ncbi:MAG: homocysteine S-methyltransferase family protein [Bacteroidetes bacterium]|jgi:S-methylmethionine-dependent homocysteine/selenocysteine methylase|nr:homocysteine S-methyltransferase family protein [Bacteroidota bacterium]